MLRKSMGDTVNDDIIYSPTDQTIVKLGDIVTSKHLEVLERVGESSRNAIAERTRRDLESALSEGKRESE